MNSLFTVLSFKCLILVLSINSHIIASQIEIEIDCWTFNAKIAGSPSVSYYGLVICKYMFNGGLYYANYSMSKQVCKMINGYDLHYIEQSKFNNPEIKKFLNCAR